MWATLLSLIFVVAFSPSARSAAAQSSTIAKPPAGMAPVSALNPLDAIAWMKGGTWVAEMKDKNGKVTTRVETRIRGSENGHLMKFTTVFVENNHPHLQYEGVYMYNPQSKQIEFYYTDSEGNYTRGHAAFADATRTLTQDFDIVHTNGQADTLRSLVVRDGDDAYNWNVMSNKSGEWKEIFHLRYARERGAE
jgi:hypothetical protein